jgi:hypothetical protein
MYQKIYLLVGHFKIKKRQSIKPLWEMGFCGAMPSVGLETHVLINLWYYYS